MDRRPKSNSRNFTQDIRKGLGIPRKPKTDDKPSHSKGIQCHECEGYGHVRAECATYLKNQKKSLTVSWSDDELSDNEEGIESAKQITALTGICASETDSREEELTYDGLADSYRELCLKSEEVCRTLERQNETISKLQTEKRDNISKINALQEK
ncbi:gag-protease polyprotein, partial [Trifolium pratense]